MTTKDNVQQNIISRLKTEPTLIEGGTVQDIVGSVSYELADIIDTQIDAILRNAFVTTADDEHLVIKGEELGIYKKEATSAYVMATITDAASNVLVSSDIQARTSSNLIYKVSNEVYTDENGSATVKMECLTFGAIGNIKENLLNEFVESYYGFENAKITNLTAGYNGYDEETTEEYRERILDYMKDDACNSNITDYIYWAKSVSGVKHVVVKDAFSAGPGKVDVYVSAINNDIISNELLTSVKEKILEDQIINALVTVYPLEYSYINVNADISLKEGADIEDIENKFKILLEEYLNTKPSFISYLYISNLFFEIEGVLDVSNYLLNGASSSITISELQVPVAGEIELLNAEE